MTTFAIVVMLGVPALGETKACLEASKRAAAKKAGVAYFLDGAKLARIDEKERSEDRSALVFTESEKPFEKGGALAAEQVLIAETWYRRSGSVQRILDLAPGSACGELHVQEYRRGALDKPSVNDIMMNIDTAAIARSMSTFRRPFGVRHDRVRCDDDNPRAEHVIVAIRTALDCKNDEGAFQEVCRTISTMSLCEYATGRAGRPAALAADVIRLLLKEANLSEIALGDVGPLLTRLPHEFVGAHAENLHDVANAMLAALTSDARARWLALRKDKEPLPATETLVFAVAAVNVCREAEREGVADCPLAKVVSDLGGVDADAVAAHLMAAQPGTSDESESEALNRLNRALDAWSLAARRRWCNQAPTFDQIRDVLRFAQRGDLEAIASIASHSKLVSHPEKAALHDLTLGARRRLTAERSETSHIALPSNERHWSFGAGVMAIGGVELSSTPAFTGPIALPFGFGTYERNSGLYFQLAPLDAGRYLAFDPQSDVRTPHALDVVSPSGSIGWGWGDRFPLAICADIGVARAASSERAFYAAVGVGFFLPFLDLSELSRDNQ